MEEHLASMLIHSGNGTRWLEERLHQYVESKEIAPPPAIGPNDSPQELAKRWQCWEEFNERDIQERCIARSVKQEQFWSGDVIVWQPTVPEEPAADAPRSPNAEVDTGEGG